MSAEAARFAPGDPVRVKAMFPPGHCRTPHYARGRSGTVLHLADREPNPEELAYGRRTEPLPVYSVAFARAELWPDDPGAAAGREDRIVIDIFEPWLEPDGGA